MDTYWLKVGRDIYDDSWKDICWFISCDCSWLASTTSSQRKTYVLNFFDKDSIKHLLGLQLWHLLKYSELTEVVRKNYKLFIINLLNKIRNLLEAKMLKLKVGTNLMLTVNVDIQDHIIKAQTGIIRHVEFPQGSVCKV